MDILDRSFNIAVLQACNRILPCGFDVSAEAPNTFEALKAHHNATGRILVWSGASDYTIFGDREINFAFRAWHDSRHLIHNLPFTFAGESAVARIQAKDILAIYGLCDSFFRFVRYLQCEIVGQAIFKEARGDFPENQIAFARAYLKDSGAALCGDYDI